MSKEYTFMCFSGDKMGRVRTFTLSLNVIAISIALIFCLMSAFGVSLYYVKKYQVRNSMFITADDGSITQDDLQSQLTHYTAQLRELTEKVNSLDELEYRIRDLVTLQHDNVVLKPVAIGGKEVDLLRDYSSAAAFSEKDFFEKLDKTLQKLSFEVSAHELKLSELAAALEEKRSVMLYTPTIWPVHGWLSSQFGYRISPFTGRQTFHEGIDIAARVSTDVAATADGVVVYAGPKAGYGYLVTIDHGYGYMTRYGHNSVLMVRVGDKVERGKIISKVGSTGQSTGPHVHYEVLVNGIPVNPLKFIIDNDVLL